MNDAKLLIDVRKRSEDGYAEPLGSSRHEEKTPMSHLFSASQISTAKQCFRKWGWQRLDGLVPTTNKYAQSGIEVHRKLESWLRDRILPDDGSETSAVARAIIPHLPPPQAVHAQNVERSFDITIDDVPFRGYIDLLHVDDCETHVYDHKTTSDFRWAKSSDELVVDVQATLYAAVAMQECSADIVHLHWNYALRKKSSRVLPVVRTVTFDEIAPCIESTVATAKQLQQIYVAGLKAIDLPYDASQCEAFGGCPFRQNCNLSPLEKFQSIMTQEATTMTFQEKLLARKAALAAPPAAVAAPAMINPPLAVVPPTAAPAPVEAPPAPVSDVAALPKRRGRPPKEATSTTITPLPAAIAAPSFGFTLYVDCAPVKGGTNIENAADRIAYVMREFATATGLSHYKLGQGEELGFGRGTALFAEGVARDLIARPPSGDVVISTSSNESRDCLQAFFAAATVVVQG